MAPLQNRGLIEHTWVQDVKFLSKEKFIENNNGLVVISLSKVGENEFLQTYSQFTK